MSIFKVSSRLFQRKYGTDGIASQIQSSVSGTRRMATAVAAESQIGEDPDLATAKPFSEIPALPALPLIGSAWVYFPFIGKYDTRKLHIAGIDKYKKYGDVVLERAGKMNIVISFRPEDLETMFKHEGKYPHRVELLSMKTFRESRKQRYANTGLLFLQGEKWHDLRSKTQPHLMKPKAVAAYLEPMQDVAEDLLKRIAHVRDENDEVADLLPELYRWALESVSFIGMDTRLGCLQNNLSPDSDGERMIETVQTMIECMFKLEAFSGNLLFWKYFPTPLWRKFERAADIFTEISYKYINRSLERLKTKSDDDKSLTLLQAMLAMEGFDVPRAMVTVSDLLMAGIDTTSHTVGYFLYHLARNPDKQELLYQEVAGILNSETQRVTQSSFNELKYLKACLKESMRLDPVLSGTSRTLDHDVSIAGYRVPAGTMIVVGSQIIYRLEKHFKDADKFLPERWLDKENKPHPYLFLPFSFGPRSCVGRRIAELEMICLVAQIVRRFRVEYHYEDIGMITRMINYPDRPLKFRFIDR